MAESTWQVVGTSVRGTSHEKTGLPCQDAFAWERTPHGILIAAVADGAGTAALADVGATLAARTAVSTLRAAASGDTGGLLDAFPEEPPWESLLRHAVQAALAAVEAEAASRQTKLRDLASTLIVVAATPDLVAAAQIGDGAAVVADDAGTLRAVTAPASGEYLNETVFLTSPGALDALQCVVWRGRAAHLAVFSDGLQMLALKMPAATPHAPFFAPLFRFAAGQGADPDASGELAGFLSSAGVRQRTDDDLTLLLATRVGVQGPRSRELTAHAFDPP